jgi:hypothetical protein
MRKIIIICSVLISIIVIIAIKYFAQLAGKDNNVAKCISFIPSDAALILNFDNDESFYEIFKDYQLFDAIVGKQRSLEIEQVRQSYCRLSRFPFYNEFG